MTLEDLSSHDSEVITPISTTYKVSSQRCLLYICFNNVLSRLTDFVVVSGCASVGASSQQSGAGCPAPPQHPGKLSSTQR